MIFSRKFRKGASLVELLFSIVILAIILSPIPKLINSIGETAEIVALKDAISIGTAKTMQLSLYYWDEHSRSSTYGNTRRILDTNSSNFGRVSNSIIRACGLTNRLYFVITEDTNRTLISASTPPYFHDDDEYNSSRYDDFDDWKNFILEYNSSRGADMKSFDFQLSFDIYYISDSYGGFLDRNSSRVTIVLDKSDINSEDTNLTSNLKFAKLRATQLDSDNPLKFNLQYISANIGEVDYKARYIE